MVICRFLGYVDKLGTAYKDPIIATGYGSMLATPVMRAAVDAKLKEGNGEITEKDARTILEDCMKILYYRDARAHSKVTRMQIVKNHELRLLWINKINMGIIGV